MKDHFALLPKSGDSGVAVRCDHNGIWLSAGLDVAVVLTPAEARQIAAALTRLAALRPVPTDAA